MGRYTNMMKERAEELLEGYEDAKAVAFMTELDGEMDGMDVSEMDIDFFQGFIDSFTFADEGDWAFDAVQSELDDIGDQMHEQARDERCGL